MFKQKGVLNISILISFLVSIFIVYLLLFVQHTDASFKQIPTNFLSFLFFTEDLQILTVLLLVSNMLNTVSSDGHNWSVGISCHSITDGTEAPTIFLMSKGYTR